MNDDTLTEIINICLSIDKSASEIYSTFSSSFEGTELENFWREMSEEENEHVKFWGRFLALARKGMLPEVFDDPDQTKVELEEIQEKVQALLSACTRTRTVPDAFIIAYRTEFYVMEHAAFATLFHYMDTISEEENLGDVYDAHISKFIDAYNKYGRATPELELLGETLQHLWKETKNLARQSYLDQLTGVLNRRGFFKATKPLAHLAQRNRAAVGILMVDIDNFKKVNDTYGHQKGDAVLESLARIMRASTRISDLVGRYGGEEFIVYLAMTRKGSVYGIAEKMRKMIETETRNDIPVTVSIGAAEGVLGSNVEEDVLSLIKKADACLYKAKARGRNRVVIDG